MEILTRLFFVFMHWTDSYRRPLCANFKRFLEFPDVTSAMSSSSCMSIMLIIIPAAEEFILCMHKKFINS